MIAQGTAEWLQSRAGCLTASRMRDILKKKKSGEYAVSRENMICAIAQERFSGKVAQNFVNQAMQDGIDREPVARKIFEELECVIVEQAGFIKHPAIPFFGCSPDGLLSNCSFLEIKCPTFETYNRVIEFENISDYLPQIHAQAAVLGRNVCYLAFYHPAADEALKTFKLDITEADISVIESQAIEALELVNAVYLQLIDTARDSAIL